MTASSLPDIIERSTGLALARGGGHDTMNRFVSERMAKLGLVRIEAYATLVADPTSEEHRRLIDAITVPHTWFYRDAEQLQVIAGLLSAAPAGPLAIWVAGCATGEEAYTLAIIGRRIGRELTVIATDVNERALAAAKRGVYNAVAVRDVPPDELHWFTEQDNGFVIDPALRTNLVFLRHNLVDSPPVSPRGAWDLVICRNVLIYFAQPAAARVMERFARGLREGGSLIVGGSEVVLTPPPGLKLVASGPRMVLRRLSHLPTAAPAARASIPLPARWSATDPAIPRPTYTTDPAIPRPPTSNPALSILRTDPAISRESAPAGRDNELVAALNRGHAQFERGDLSAAIAVYAELARVYPSVAEVWLFLGIARYAHGEANTAAHALRASLCLDPAMWPAGFYLARAYDRLGRHADALQQYDLIAGDDQQPLTLQSSSAVINELRAFRHDFRSAARRVAAERPSPTRRPTK